MKDQQALPQSRFAALGARLRDLGDRIRERREGKWLVRAVKHGTPILLAALISAAKFPFATYPLGFSLLAAAREDTVHFYIGTLLFALVAGEWPSAVGATTLLLFRFLFSRVLVSDAPLAAKGRLWEKLRTGPRPFGESETLRLATASLAAFTAGMLRVVAGGFTFGDLLGTCLAVVICPAVTYLYSGSLLAAERRGVRYEIGCIALLCSLVFALECLPTGLSLSVAVAAFFAIALARCKAPPYACLFALLLILPAEPLLAPAFGIAAALAASLFPRSRLYAVTVSAVAFAAVSFFAGGLWRFATAFPEFLLGAAVASTIPAASVEAYLPFFGDKKSVAEHEILGYKEQKSRESISDISEAFAALSKTFFELSDKETRIGLFDTRRICDRVLDRHCRRCALRSLCWERDYAVTLEAVNRVSAQLYKYGKVQKSELPPAFAARCEAADRILEDVGRENRRALRAILKEDKTRAFAVDYAVFARVLSEALEKNEAEYAPDVSARNAVTASLRKIGFSADSIGVYGNRCKKVHAFRLSQSAMRCSADAIRAALTEALGCPMEDPLFEFADGAIHMVCHAAPRISVTASVASLAAGQEEENGDRVISFDGKNGYWYALVSDGMGSGPSAARKSGAATVFLEKMLRAGNSVSAGMDMLSALARADGEEGFTTLDLFEIDCLAARGSFIKSGAAPSFVRRGNKLYKIRSRTFPLGILEDVDAERTTFDLLDGDRVVLLSDGVTEEVEEPLWLCEFLTAADLSAPDAAERILAEAKKHTLGRDDMTAAVVTVRGGKKNEDALS